MLCKIFVVFVFICLSFHVSVHSTSKYSKELNERFKEIPQNEERQFRMLKFNLLWEKATKKLPAPKLKNLKTDLKDLDKEEIVLKRVKSEGGDKDGLKEAEVRKRLRMILKKYDLEDVHQDETLDNLVHKVEKERDQIFKDKKLDKLWQKAINSGFDDEQLKLLKEEFKHHQDKVDDYHRLIREYEEQHPSATDEEIENAIHLIPPEEKVEKLKISKHQSLQDKHVEVKKSYESLKTKVRDRNFPSTNGEFDEPNVQKLWNLAKTSDFSTDELESLREELTHYQNRIKKLKYFEDQLEFDEIQGKQKVKPGKEESHLERKIKELNVKIDKVHKQLESKIMRRHIEL